MRFQPKSEEEIQTMSLMHPGIYDFEVIKATDKVSRSGKEMIELQLSVWDTNGKPHTIYDYLMDAMAYKLRHFTEVAGLIDKYNAGIIDEADCLGKSGSVEIIIQKGQPKPDGGFYSDKNSVKDYIVGKPRNNRETKEEEITFSDDVPF
jgi:hypothetical protein